MWLSKMASLTTEQGPNHVLWGERGALAVHVLATGADRYSWYMMQIAENFHSLY